MTKTSLCLASLAFVLLIGHLNAQAHLWRFDENKGKIAYDDTCSGKWAVNGKLNNDYWLDLSKVGPGAAVQLTGADDSYVDFGKTVGQFCKDDFSVAFWIQTTDTNRLFDLVGNRQAAGHGSFFGVRMTGDGYITAEVDGDSRGNNYILVKSKQCGLNDGNWHQVVVTRCGNTLTLYIDGECSDSCSARGVANIENRNPFILGRSLVDRKTSCFGPDAVFDDLAIYNEALSARDVKELYKCASNQ